MQDAADTYIEIVRSFDIITCRFTEQHRQRSAGRERGIVLGAQAGAQHGEFEVDVGQGFGGLVHEGGGGLEDGVVAGGAFVVGEAALGGVEAPAGGGTSGQPA